MFVHPGLGHGAKLHGCYPLPLCWGPVHVKHWSVSHCTSSCQIYVTQAIVSAVTVVYSMGAVLQDCSLCCWSHLHYVLCDLCYDKAWAEQCHVHLPNCMYVLFTWLWLNWLLFCRAIKTIIAESCDATNQAKAMGYMTAGWGVGTIAGPTIGGFLANPCDSFASGTSLCAPGSWLMERCDMPQSMLHAPCVGTTTFHSTFHSQA